MDHTRIILARLAAGDALPDIAENRVVIDKLQLSAILSKGQVKLTEPIELLDAGTIHSHIDANIAAQISSVDIHRRIKSTNTYLMSRINAAGFHGSVCLSESQSAGRGRRGRVWASPFGKNIYLSLGWQMQNQKGALEGLSLVVGLQVAKSLASFGVEGVSVKWPNDIILRDGKLSGILIEMGAPAKGQVRLVIGVGVNLGMNRREAETIDQPWSATGVIDGMSRNKLCARLITNILKELSQFSKTGFAPYMESWNACNYFLNKPVRILSGEQVVYGLDRGVDERGNLMLETGEGMLAFNAGEVSLRAGSE
ncbi:MAG: biotin--[acetyl-CoA-carboxylase] ligase [Pseudomonadales bacterium]|nr:biotin--[acetyl-CoA-carboxylase] ligase [Pseudomonadales bacterium]